MATGNKKGFTLLELMVVLAIVATVAAGVGLSLPDSRATQLQTQAERLAALLEGARAQSRTLGVPIYWRATKDGFAWDGLPASPPESLPTTWQVSGVAASSPGRVVLGPEPIVAAQSVRVWRLDAPELALQVATDGVQPFAVQNLPR